MKTRHLIIPLALFLASSALAVSPLYVGNAGQGETQSLLNVGTTSTDALILQTNTDATSLLDQWSPAAHWTGYAWTGSASVPVDWYGEVQTTGANGNLVLSYSLNRGSRTAVGTLAYASSIASFSTGQLKSTVATGTPPLVVASTTNVANLNASSLAGATFAAPGAIGSTTPAAGSFTVLSVKSGTNALAGTVTLASGNGTITSTLIDANTVIVFSLKTSSGTPGLYQPLAAVGAGSATVTGLATDNSTYNWTAIKVQ